MNGLRLVFTTIMVVSLLAGTCAGSSAAVDISDYLRDLEADDWVVRRDAITALGDLGEAAAEAIPVLEGLLYDDLWAIRDSTARSLGKMGPAAVPALTSALHHEDIQTQLVVIRALEDWS